MDVAPRLARVLGSIAVAAGLAFSAPAQAELVYEVYVGNRPADADRYMAPVREAMRELGIAGPREIAARFSAAPRPSIVDPKVAAAHIVDQIELGYRSVLQGRDFKAASQTLANALELAHDNPALFLGDANLRTEITRALVALGVSLNRTGEPARAKEAFTELSRMLGGQALRGYGKEAERLYDVVNGPLAKGPRGRLTVEVNVPDARIFVDDDGETRGNTFSGDMIPGKHRLLIAVKDRSLAYDVMVDANKETSLDLDWTVEQSLVISDSWVGFRVQSPLDRSRGLVYAKVLSRRSSRETTAIALGVEKVCGRLAVTGVRYGLGPKLQQVSAKVLLGQRDEARLRALARFLVRDEKSPEVISGDQSVPCAGVAKAPPEEEESATAVAAPLNERVIHDPGGPMWPSYVMGVLGLAAVGTGAYLVYLDGKGTCPGDPADCQSNYHTAKAGWATGAAGAAVVGLAVIWYVTHRGSSAPAATAALAAGNGALVFGRF